MCTLSGTKKEVMSMKKLATKTQYVLIGADYS